MNNSVKELYDSLTHAESFFGWRKPKSTVHKTLDFSRSPSLQAYTGRDINHLIQSLPLGLNAESHILDAGCGHGGTLTGLIEKHNCQGIGISLSPSQIETAKTLFTDARANFIVGTYDNPPAGPFDLIITLESLIHSTDLTVSYQALSSRLTNNGYLLIVEDMFISPFGEAVADSRFSPNQLQQSWCLTKLYTDTEHFTAAQEAGLRLCSTAGLHVADLSECVTHREIPQLSRAIATSRFITRLLPQSRLKTALEAAIGGYILEYLYATGLATYKLMVFESLCKD